MHPILPGLAYSGPVSLDFSWSPDGQYVLVSSAGDEVNGFALATIYTSAGTLVRRLSGADLPNLASGPYWAADADDLVYAGNRSGVTLRNLASGRRESMAPPTLSGRQVCPR